MRYSSLIIKADSLTHWVYFSVLFHENLNGFIIFIYALPLGTAAVWINKLCTENQCVEPIYHLMRWWNVGDSRLNWLYIFNSFHKIFDLFIMPDIFTQPSTVVTVIQVSDIVFPVLLSPNKHMVFLRKCLLLDFAKILVSPKHTTS